MGIDNELNLGRSWHIGTFWGIPVKIHWTFGLLLLFVIYTGYENDLIFTEILWFGVYVLALFLCVLLHEFGHALTARRYKIKTQDIILSPIGGLARMERLPKRPWHELLVAIAGPMVNVVIAIALGFLFYFVFGFSQFLTSDSFNYIATPPGFLSYLIAANIALFAFNLIPAFPMDGGRILRALLAMWLDRSKATKYASWVGRILAVGFVFLAFSYNVLTLGLIGVFIFFMATAENRQMQIETAMDKVKIASIMRKDFTRIHIGDHMSTVINQYFQHGEKNFLVFDSLGYIVGSIPDLFIRNAIKKNHTDVLAKDYLSQKIIHAHPDMELLDLYHEMNKQGAAIAGVYQSGELVGVVDRNQIQDFVQARM